MDVLVNGLGTVGTTLAAILLEERELLGIDDVYVNKNQPQSWLRPDLDRLQARGAVLCSTAEEPGLIPLDGVADEIAFVFDCTNGQAVANRPRYEKMPEIRGANAQGSEIGFGVHCVPFVNGEIAEGMPFVRLGSCNTHAISAILTALAGDSLDALEHGDFVIVRRSEDLGKHERLVTSGVVARHRDPTYGTHHAEDVVEVFETTGTIVELTSSDITTPSQLMHAIRFRLTLESMPDDVLGAIDAHPWLATTEKFDSNAVFELGRRYGFHGRLFEHAIVVANNLIVDDMTVSGWAFVPQEGNTILSTVHAFLLQVERDGVQAIMSKLRSRYLRSRW